MKLIVLTVLSTLALVHADVNCESAPECLVNPKVGESLPVTEEEIQEECRDYKQFQDCLRTWSKECLSPENVEMYHANVEKSMKFLKALCNNKKFRDDYIAEKESFDKLAPKWQHCNNVFQNVQSESAVLNNNTIPHMEVCCGLQSFNDCTEKLCETDCSGPAKEMVGRIIEMFKSGYDVINCKTIELSTCPTTSGSTRALYSFVSTLMPVVALVVLRH